MLAPLVVFTRGVCAAQEHGGGEAEACGEEADALASPSVPVGAGSAVASMRDEAAMRNCCNAGSTERAPVAAL